MSAVEISIIVSIISVLAGAILGWVGYARLVKKDIAVQAGIDATTINNILHIKNGIDAIKSDQRDHINRLDNIAERVTRIEESVRRHDRQIEKIEAI